MSLVVRKSSPVVVRPSPETGTTRGTIKLSSFDKGLYNMPSTTLLVFEHPLHNAAETIRGALSRALAHYYPIASRIVVAGGGGGGSSGGGDVYIECNDEGVAFVAAHTDHALKEVICFDRSPAARKLLDQLAVYYPGMSCGPGDPLLLMQVTEFSCGGFVLGVTWNHGGADGAGMGQFLRAVGELSGGSPSPSVAPVSSFGQRCTTFEAALAVLWRCRTRAIRPDPEAPTLLVFLADMRKHAGAKEGGAVAAGDVRDAVMAIRRAKDQLPDRLKEDEEGVVGRHELREIRAYDTLTVTSWRNLGFDRVDFGSGRPARVTASGKDLPPSPGAVGFLSDGRGGGVSVLSDLVRQEHADAFLAELAKFI
ncbi:acyl transferase 15-like [Panicum virgatum]|uniref:acyl transferase 15-like n=1 Tax=Panicum virgatum TaxID=38727 RepID=UPI0019D65F40|nr:acyl transferase 15-like [Panicum virgatum]